MALESRPLLLFSIAASLPTNTHRFCKTDIHAEILVPYIHFYTRAYDSRLLDKAPAFNAKWVQARSWGTQVHSLQG